MSLTLKTHIPYIFLWLRVLLAGHFVERLTIHYSIYSHFDTGRLCYLFIIYLLFLSSYLHLLFSFFNCSFTSSVTGMEFTNAGLQRMKLLFTGRPRKPRTKDHVIPSHKPILGKWTRTWVLRPSFPTVQIHITKPLSDWSRWIRRLAR